VDSKITKMVIAKLQSVRHRKFHAGSLGMCLEGSVEREVGSEREREGVVWGHMMEMGDDIPPLWVLTKFCRDLNQGQRSTSRIFAHSKLGVERSRDTFSLICRFSMIEMSEAAIEALCRVHSSIKEK
jgi:hypothetical protein